MRVIALREHGGVDQLKVENWDVPAPAAGQVLVKIEACGLNYMDVFVMHGMPDLPTEMPRIPGGDVAGRVVELRD